MARGCKPKKLVIVSHNSHDPLLFETTAHAFLRHAAPARTVTKLELQSYASATPALVEAICGLGPQLSELDIHFLERVYSDEPLPDLDPDFLAKSTLGSRLLLQRLGPQLKSMHLSPDTRRWPPSSLAALSCCTAVTQLGFHYRDRSEVPATESDILHPVFALTNLRDLNMSEGGRPPADLGLRATRAASLFGGFSALTALTRLELNLDAIEHYPRDARYNLDDKVEDLQANGHVDEATQLYAAAAAEWSALLAAVKDLPSLAVLRTRARVPASDLAALTSLTYLRVGKLVMPLEANEQAPQPFAVPPRLRRLDSYMPVSPRVVARLAPSPPSAPEALAAIAEAEKKFWPRLPPPPALGLLAGGRLWRCEEAPWCLAFDEEDCDEETSRLVPEAAEAMCQAASVLTRYFDFLEAAAMDEYSRGLCVAARHPTNGYVQPPPPPAPLLIDGDLAAEAQAAGAILPDGSSHCASWLGSLAAAVRPVFLQLEDLMLSARDMMGLAECMAGIQVLKLHRCSYSVSSLPLLGGMQHLRELYVHFDDWYRPGNVDVLDLSDPVEAAFLALTATTSPSPHPQPSGAGDAAPAASGVAAAAGSGASGTRPLPRLQLLEVGFTGGPEYLRAWLNLVLAKPRENLEQRLPAGAELRVRFED